MNKEKLKVESQYLMPKKLITRLSGFMMSARMGKATTYMIKKFAKHYNINVSEAEKPLEDYKTFNEFFARELKKNARPLDTGEKSAVFPADGKISELGNIKDDLLIQAKNHYYTAESLLADEDDAKTFANGKFITIYLSPKDYHRVHIPLAGRLLKMTYVPGEAFSVNPNSAEYIPELFARNERVVSIFETSVGKMAVVMVGATIVRSISTAWAGIVAPSAWNEPATFTYDEQEISFSKGAEIGKFMMGSTVICLFEKDAVKFDETLCSGSTTVVRAKMAETK